MVEINGQKYPTAKDRTGERVGKLTAVRADELGTHGIRWLYRCACGGETVMYPFDAKVKGHCGCLTPSRMYARRLKHGQANTRYYKAWHAMLERCNNPNNKFYSYYGGRGIKVCDRWHAFENFASDMGPREPGMTIDRVDNNGNYEPDNCRWASRKTQQNNRRACRMVTLRGKTQSLTMWCEELGIPRGTVRSRLNRGWDLIKAITEPVKARRGTRKGRE